MLTGMGSAQYRLEEASQKRLAEYFDEKKGPHVWMRVKCDGDKRVVTLLSPLTLNSFFSRVWDILSHPIEYLCGFFGSRNIQARDWLNKEYREKFSRSAGAALSTSDRVKAVAQKPPLVRQEVQDETWEKRLIDALIEKGIEKDVASKIANGALHNWEGFFEEVETEKGRLCKQTHGIEGLKVYRDPKTKELIADIALERVGAGGFKRAKGVSRVISQEDVDEIVRYTKEKNTREGRVRFALDVKKELDVRRELKEKGPIPHLLDIYEAYYVNSAGSVKTRYLTEKCDGDLRSFFKKDKKLSLKEEREIFQYCFHALKALLEMHERGFVHNDIKPGNIFFNLERKEGVLADLGGAARVGKRKAPVFGSNFWLSPEKIFHEYQREDPKSDIYSFGLILLKTHNKGYFDKIKQAQANPKKSVYEALTKKLQKTLRGEGKMGALIAGMIDFDPQERPVGSELLSKYQESLIEDKKVNQKR